MAKIGFGYGSEWHLLWYLARHRAELNARVIDLTAADRVEWLDYPIRSAGDTPLDEEWKGLDFLEDDVVIDAWREFWLQGAGIQNWDGIAKVRMAGWEEWLLVEAKGHCGEIESSCGAKPGGGLEKIRAALNITKQALGVSEDQDWLNGYYQFCNRLAVLHFLQIRGVRARLLFIYFTGDSTAGRECPQSEAGWQAALDRQAAHVGLPTEHPLAARVHKLFLPVFANVRRSASA